jgi:acetyl esterase/lipase
VGRTDRDTIVLEPAAQAFSDAAAKGPFSFEIGPEKTRAGLAQLQSGPVATPVAELRDVDVLTPEGAVSVRVVRPSDAPATLPVVLYLHAGWIAGDAGTHDRLIRELADGVQAAIVFPSFTLSPEARFPTAINQIYAVAEWVRDEGAALGLDPSRVAIAGDSAGGTMATVVAMMAKERGGPSFAHQLLFYPVTDAGFDTPSYEQFATGFHVPRRHVQWMWDQYLPDVERRSDPLAAPLRASTDDLAGLPPATVITAEADVVRDEGEAYAGRLREAGVPVTAVRYLGTIHDFVLLNALQETNAAQAAMTQAIVTLQRALGTAEDSRAR